MTTRPALRSFTQLCRTQLQRPRQQFTPILKSTLPVSPCPRRPIATTPRIHQSALEQFNVFDESSLPIAVENVSEDGFLLSEGLIVPGPCIFLNGTVFLWDVQSPAKDDLSWKGWTTEQFAVLEAIFPRPEILVVGTGKSTLPLAPHLRKFINDLGIQIDVQDSRHAAATFNLLSEENRQVAAALLPIVPNLRWKRDRVPHSSSL